MPVRLTNNVDIDTNSVSLCDEDSVANILDPFPKKTNAIHHPVGIPPETLNTLQKLADNINNDQIFYNTIAGMLKKMLMHLLNIQRPRSNSFFSRPW